MKNTVNIIQSFSMSPISFNGHINNVQSPKVKCSVEFYTYM